MGGSNKTQTQTQSQTSGPAQYIQDAYKSLVGQAQGVANASYDPATGKQIAGLTGNQNQGIAGVQNNQGSYQPYLQNAASAAAAGVAPVSTQSILDNYNPFVQAQIDALQANLGQQNAQTMQQTNSNAAKIGALTGDRSQIASQIATNDNNRNAANAMAGLQSQAFGQAANLAQGNQNAALQGANVYSNLGTMAQNAGYNDANALLGVGGLQQTQQQNVLDANSQNAQAQAAYPYQNLQWLSGILGNASSGSGQTSTGSTSTPGPNMWSQIAGAGLAGLGVAGGLGWKPFAKDGGRINGFAGGGGVDPQPSLGVMSAPDNGMGDLINRFTQAKQMFASGGGVAGYDDGGFVEEEDTGPYGSVGMEEMWGAGGQPGFSYEASAMAPVSSGVAAAAPSESLGPLGLSRSGNDALIATGLGMLASKSPFVGTAIGEGGLAGLQTYRQGRASEQAHALKEQSVSAQANRLAQQAASAADALKFRTRQQDEVERHNKAVEAKAAAEREAQYGKTGAVFQDKDGNFFTVQFGADGSKLIEPVGPGMMPAKGVTNIGDELVSNATGETVRKVGDALAGGEAAKTTGKAAGESKASLASLRSKMPGLEKVVSELDKLSEEATYTTAGKALDLARREMGLEPRDAAIARKRYIAMVDNQVLPMLRDTFGAAFTQKEGDSLKATLGDPDASPQEKQAVLKAFIEQKRRNIEATAAETSEAPAGPQPGTVIDGYIFTGGNPADRSSWEKQ